MVNLPTETPMGVILHPGGRNILYCFRTLLVNQHSSLVHLELFMGLKVRITYDMRTLTLKVRISWVIRTFT